MYPNQGALIGGIILWVLLALLGIFISYWVIRLAVKHALLDVADRDKTPAEVRAENTARAQRARASTSTEGKPWLDQDGA